MVLFLYENIFSFVKLTHTHSVLQDDQEENREKLTENISQTTMHAL